jgi:hypothetical protein
MMFAPGGLEVSRRHALILAQVARREREEQAAAEAEGEAARYKAMMLAPAYAEAMALQRAAVDAEHARAERAEEQARAERAAAIEDWRTGLLLTGTARWRTVSEVLADARGAMMMDASPPPAQIAQRSTAQGEGEPGWLLARSAALSAAWDRDPVLRRARLAAAESADLAEGAAIETWAAYPAREITRVCDGQARIW